MLANERRVAAATHRQALSALLFLYREVLDVDMPWRQELGRPAQKRRIPVVLTPLEVQKPPPRAREPSPCYLLPPCFPRTPSFTAVATSVS